MHYNEYTLPNGLRIIHEPTLSKVAYCGFAIDAERAMRLRMSRGWLISWNILFLKGRRSGKRGISLTAWRMWAAI